MARRRRKQAKKGVATEPVEEVDSSVAEVDSSIAEVDSSVAEVDSSVAEVDSSVTEEEASSQVESSQKEEEIADLPVAEVESSQKEEEIADLPVAEVESSPATGQAENADSNQSEEKMVTDEIPEASSENPEDSTSGSTENAEKDDEPPNEKDEDPVDQEVVKIAVDSSINQLAEAEAIKEEDPTEEKMDSQESNLVEEEPAKTPGTLKEEQDAKSEGDTQVDAPTEEAKAEEKEVEPLQTKEDVQQQEQAPQQMEVGETIEKATESQDAEMKEQLGEKEEDDTPIIRIEKEPTVPYCYDDNNVPVPIDPEGDEGEVLIGNESPEFLKYWRAVLDNPHDFTNWTYLLQLVEQENKPPLARRAYIGFFKRYPLCYGYWKKFSELEKRNGNLVRAQRILERGVRAIPLSIDLWVHMIDFYINFYKGPDAGKDKIRRVFERAASASGEEFRSEKLWNKYLQWEKDNQDLKAVIALYDRVLKLPTQHYAVFFKDCKEFVQSCSPKDLLSLEEFEELLEEVRADVEKSDKTSNKKKEEAKESSTAPAVDDTDPPGVEASDRGKPPNDKELKAVSEKLVAKKKKIFEETEALVTKIWTFEEGIKRPYFHVKALERTQIKNWRDYLEAEMSKEENHKRIILLFERCLIACALYEDFWVKYARYLMKTDEHPRARVVYQRACEIHLPKKPNVHLHWASFEELQGNYEASAKILVNLAKTLPNLALVNLRRVAIERRAGHLQAAEELFKGFIETAAKGSEECFYIRKYVWFLVQVSKKVDVARQVLKDAITKNADQVQLYKDLVGLEFSHGNEETISQACDLALESEGLSDETKFQFSQRKLEYMEDFGTNAKLVQKIYDDHQKLFRGHKKRHQSTSDSSQPDSKKAKTESSTPSSGSKIQTTEGTRQTYSAKPTKNGPYASQATVSAQPQLAAPIQTTGQAYPQTAAAGDPSLYYQNYWNNYQTQNPEQYQYGQWPAQYSQQSYYQQ